MAWVDCPGNKEVQEPKPDAREIAEPLQFKML